MLELPPGRNGKLIEFHGFTIFASEDYLPEIIEYLEGGDYENRECWLAKHTLTASDKVIEAGTAIGVVAMTAASIVGAANIATFDANPEMVADARLNFERNGFGQIKSHCGILKNRRSIHDKNEIIDFHIDKNFLMSRMGTTERDVDVLRTVHVPVLCLEDEIAAHQANVLIFDIEGGEVELLMHADLRGITKILMETHYWAVGERETDAMIRKLTLDGFSIHLGISGQDIIYLRRSEA